MIKLKKTTNKSKHKDKLKLNRIGIKKRELYLMG